MIILVTSLSTRFNSAKRWGMSTRTTSKAPATRGPAEHSVRDQIVTAAHDYFAHYGYAKTTVADLAREIGFSKAYIYRFFESKQAIGEAICAGCLDRLFEQVHRGRGGAGRHGQVAQVRQNRDFRGGRVVLRRPQSLRNRRPGIVREVGRGGSLPRTSAGLARRDPQGRPRKRRVRAQDAARRDSSVDILCPHPFIDPVFLERSLDVLPDAQVEVTGLVLRSLAP